MDAAPVLLDSEVILIIHQGCLLTPNVRTERICRLHHLSPERPLVTSGGNWQGVTLQKHISDPDYVRTDFVVHSNLIHIFTGVPVTQEWCSDSHTHRVQNAP